MVSNQGLPQSRRGRRHREKHWRAVGNWSCAHHDSGHDRSLLRSQSPLAQVWSKDRWASLQICNWYRMCLQVCNAVMKSVWPTYRGHSGLVLWHFETDRYFGSRVGDVQGRIPVKVLPREKDAVDPGFELKYNTLTASLGNAESASKDAP